MVGRWSRAWLRAHVAAALLLVCAAFSLTPPAQAQVEQDFLEPEQAFALSAAMATPTELILQFTIAPDYYMYREQFRLDVSPPGPWLDAPILPEGSIKYDPTFDKEMEVYHSMVRLTVPLQAGASQALTLTVTSQGCAEAGLCYAPMHSTLQLAPTMAGYDVAGQGAGPLAQLGAFGVDVGGSDSRVAGSGSARQPGVASLATGGDLEIADFLANARLFNVVLAGLLLGLLLSFTPCVLPMVPILLSLIAGSAAGGRAALVTSAKQSASAASAVSTTSGTPTPPAATTSAKAVRTRGLTLALLYVLGMSIVYTGLGVAAGLLGTSLSAWLQTPWVLMLFAALLALLALAMFGVFNFQTPSSVQTALQARLARVPGGRYGGALGMGMLSALIVGPCVAAPLAGVLLFISSTGDVLLGGLALFALAWGQGALLLVLGASSGTLLPRAGAWMQQIQHVFGVLLLATAWWMLIPVLPAVALTLGWAILAFWAALTFGALRPLPPEAGPARLLARALGYVLAVWGVILLIGLAAGGRDALRPLATFAQFSTAVRAGNDGSAAPAAPPTFTRIRSARELNRALTQARQPVMLDFYADWCIACKEMERFTFSDPDVARQLTQFTLLQADVTGDVPEDRALLKQFRLFGPPGIVFFDAQGHVLPKTRVIGFQNAQRFSAVLDSVLTGAAR